jgi:hypothetical protein
VAFVTTIPAWFKFKLSKNDVGFEVQEAPVKG